MPELLPNEDQFTLYSERKPETAGVYRWRVPSVAVKGLVVEFCAHMRERGAGYQRVLSPMFDYWDGYRVHVPAGTAWQPSDAPCKSYEAVQLAPIGVEVSPCPYCHTVPKWHAVQRARGGGVVVGDDPHLFNSWWLECCAWSRTPHHEDPRELARTRNEALTALEKTP